MTLRAKDGTKFIMKNADDIHINDSIQVYGTFMKVTRVTHVNRHPIQLYELHVEGLDLCLRVPAGWQIKVAAPVSKETNSEKKCDENFLTIQN